DDARAAELTADARRLGAEALVDQHIDRAFLTAAAGARLQAGAEARAGLLQTIQRAPFALRIARLENGARPQSARVRPRGERLAVADTANRLHLLDATTLEEVAHRDAPITGWGFTYLPDGDLAVGTMDDNGPAVHLLSGDDLDDLARLPGTGTFAPMVSVDA